MAKTRIYELAKELNITSKDVIEILEKNSIEGKKASSGLEQNEEELVRKQHGGAAAKPEQAKAPETSKSEKKAEPKPEKKAEQKPEKNKADKPEKKEENKADKKPAKPDRKSVV